jgi:hypothetical protein
VRFVPLLAALVLATPAFADAGANAHDLGRICESARLSDLERRECSAMFKNAADEAARQAAVLVFHERINGHSTTPVVFAPQDTGN